MTRHSSPEVSSNTEMRNASNDVFFGLIPYGHQNAGPCHAQFLSHPDAIPQIKRSKHHQTPQISFLLDRGLVSERGNSHGRVVGERQCVSLTRSNGLTLDLNNGAAGLGLTLGLGVSLDSAEEVLTRSGLRDVLDSDVDSLLDVSVLDLLVDDDTDSGLGDVVDDTSLSVVDLEGHTAIVVSPPVAFSYTRFLHSAQVSAISRMFCRMWKKGSAYPFWTAPFALISTISPTLYCRR